MIEDIFRIVNMKGNEMGSNNTEKVCTHKYVCKYRHPTSDMVCIYCGKVIIHEQYLLLLNPVDDKFKPSDCSMEMPKFASTGWICPVCGAGNSPSNSTCPCKKPTLWSNDHTQTIRYSAGTPQLNLQTRVGSTTLPTGEIVGGDLG